MSKRPKYVGFSKTGSDTIIEPNYDVMTASGIGMLVCITKKWPHGGSSQSIILAPTILPDLLTILVMLIWNLNILLFFLYLERGLL